MDPDESSGIADADMALTVSVNVTNHGEYAGSSDEVVMVFATPSLAEPPTTAMSVPQQVLLGFTKIRTVAARLYGSMAPHNIGCRGHSARFGGSAGSPAPLSRSRRRLRSLAGRVQAGRQLHS